MNEAEAIAQLRQGDIAGLEVLMHLYQRKALRVAFLICHDSVLAEDIVQSAFVQAFEHIQQFDPTRPFAPWFFRSVANATVMALRRPTAVSLDAGPDGWGETLPDTTNLDAQIIAAETHAAVTAALAQLAPAQRAVIVMRYYLDMPDAEIAQVLACPPGTVRRRQHDARQRLQAVLPSWLRAPRPAPVGATEGAQDTRVR